MRDLFGNHHHHTKLVGGAVVTPNKEIVLAFYTTVKCILVHFRSRELFETAISKPLT